VLQLSQFRLREVLQLSMKKFFRITPLGKVKRAPSIGILKDEPFASPDGFIVRLSLRHASSVSYPPFQHQPRPGLEGAGDRSPLRNIAAPVHLPIQQTTSPVLMHVIGRYKAL
jgi:hypothetical protein